MRLTGQQFLRALDTYFSRPDILSTNFWLLLIPLIIFAIWLYIYLNPTKSNINPFDEIPEDEMNMIKQISAQKGISSFDRDFLIMQALNFNIKPINVLLDIPTYEKLEEKLEIKAKKEGISPDSDENYKNVKKLKYKIF